MMKKIFKSIALILAVAIVCGICGGAYEFKYPSAYWPLQSAWEKAVQEQDGQAVISVAQDTYDLLMPLGLQEPVCLNLEPKCARASWVCEMNGDFAGAMMWMERQMVFARWLHNNGYNYSDTFFNIESRSAYMKAGQETAIYALTDEDASPYGYGPEHGTWYGYTADGTGSGGSAVLMYINFMDGQSVSYWVNYCKNKYASFNQAATRGGVIEVAWNFSPEGTAGAEKVLSSAADSYITQGLKTLGNLNATILLRIGAEMNNWSELDASKYIAAYQKIAKQARAYDNIQLVFSPDNVSNRNVTFRDFYPGDEYVDWIGVSTYHNTNYTGSTTSYTFNASGYGVDAYYGTGIYDSDPLVILRPLVEFAEEKGIPMMISECGFSYTGTDGDQTAFAKEQMTKFFSYVNMIYPQVKAVFYFDKTIGGSGYSYAFAGSAEIRETYNSVISANGSYLSAGQTEARNWEELSNADVRLDEGESLRLATYVSFPGSAPAVVKYYVDGVLAKTVNGAPYYYDIDLSVMAAGKHTVYAVAANGRAVSTTPTYTIYVSDKGDVLAGDKDELRISSADGWAMDDIMNAYGRGLITPRNNGNYKEYITRLQFAELVVNLIEKTTGKAIEIDETLEFVDTADIQALKAASAKVAMGKGEGTFAPDAMITRQEICTMLLRAVNYMDAETGNTTLENLSTEFNPQFVDTDQIASWAVEGMARMTNNGLMGGKGDGILDPKGNTKIEEAVILVLNLYNIL